MMQEFFSRRWGWEREKGLSPHPSPTSYLRPPTAIMLNVAGHGWHQLTNIFGHSVAPSGRPLTSLRSWRDCYARGTFLMTVGFRLAPNLLAALPPKHNSTRPRISQLRRLATSHPGIYILQKSTLRQNHSANHRFVAVLYPRTAAIIICISSLHVVHVPRVDWNGRRIRMLTMLRFRSQHRRQEQVVCLWIIQREEVQRGRVVRSWVKITRG